MRACKGNKGILEKKMEAAVLKLLQLHVGLFRKNHCILNGTGSLCKRRVSLGSRRAPAFENMRKLVVSGDLVGTCTRFCTHPHIYVYICIYIYMRAFISRTPRTVIFGGL